MTPVGGDAMIIMACEPCVLVELSSQLCPAEIQLQMPSFALIEPWAGMCWHLLIR